MAIRSPINPQTIVKERQATMPAAMNFISGGSPMGSSIVSSAANKIVGFQRGAAAVAPRPPDLGSIISTLSSNILNNVENRVQSINQNVSNIVNQTLRSFGKDYQDRVKQIDDAKPTGILANFLKLYKQAIEFVQFLGNRKNAKTLGDNLQVLQTIFTETFEVAKIIRQTIVKIVKQLSNLPTASTGGGGLNLDINVPGGPLRRSAPRGIMNMLKMVGPAAAIAGGGALAVNAMGSLFGGGEEVQAVPGPGSEGLSGPILDRFSTILDRFDAAISSMTKKPAAAPRSSGGGGGAVTSETPPPSAPPGPSPGVSDGSVGANTSEESGLLKAIRFAEGTEKSYGTIFGGNVVKELEQGQLTVQEVINMADTGKLPQRLGGGPVPGYGKGSKATGAYQFMPFTLESLIKDGNLKPNEMFTNAVQDKAALALAKRRGVTSKMLEVEGFSQKISSLLAPEWASLPIASGKSYYGQPVKSLSSLQKNYDVGKKGFAPSTTVTATPTKPGVTAASTQSTTQQQIAQTVAQPPVQQQSQVNVLPINLGNQQQQPQRPTSSGAPQPAQMSSGRQSPSMNASNDDNFLTLYSKMVYNIVDG